MWLNIWGLCCSGWHCHWGNSQPATALGEKSYWSSGSTISSCCVFGMVSCMAFCLVVVRTHKKNMKDLRGWWLEDKGEERHEWTWWGGMRNKGAIMNLDKSRNYALEQGAQGPDLYRIKCHSSQLRWCLILFVSLAISRKHWRMVAVTSLGSATSLVRLRPWLQQPSQNKQPPLCRLLCCH